MTREQVQVAHVGLGAIGREVVRLLVHRTGVRVVAACDIDPDLVGTSLGDALGEDLDDDITIVESLADASSSRKGTDLVVTHTTSSSLARCLPELLAAIEAGARGGSSCGELSYPRGQAPQAAAPPHRAPRAPRGARGGPRGNPGFPLGYPPGGRSGGGQ